MRQTRKAIISLLVALFLLTGAARALGYTFTTIDMFPGAYGTYPYGINDKGHIVGEYWDVSGGGYGFLATP